MCLCVRVCVGVSEYFLGWGGNWVRVMVGSGLSIYLRWLGLG